MDYYLHNNNMASFQPNSPKHLCPFSGCLRSYALNHFYQPKTLTASWDTKHIYLFAVVMSFVCFNQAPVRHTPATSELKEREGLLFSHRVYNQCVVSNLLPPFFNFPFPFSQSNHCYQSGACLREGEVPWWNHLQPQASLVRNCGEEKMCVRECEQCRHVWMSVIKMNSGRVRLSIWAHLAFPIPSKWCTADITLSIWVLLNRHSASSVLLCFALSLLCAYWCHSRRWPVMSQNNFCVTMTTYSSCQQQKHLRDECWRLMRMSIRIKP